MTIKGTITLLRTITTTVFSSVFNNHYKDNDNNNVSDTQDNGYSNNHSRVNVQLVNITLLLTVLDKTEILKNNIYFLS